MQKSEPSAGSDKENDDEKEKEVDDTPRARRTAGNVASAFWYGASARSVCW
jgi:hypothetical protein